MDIWRSPWRLPQEVELFAEKEAREQARMLEREGRGPTKVVRDFLILLEPDAPVTLPSRKELTACREVLDHSYHPGLIVRTRDSLLDRLASLRPIADMTKYILASLFRRSSLIRVKPLGPYEVRFNYLEDSFRVLAGCGLEIVAAIRSCNREPQEPILTQASESARGAAAWLMSEYGVSESAIKVRRDLELPV
jgi:hypothetical protein